MQDITEHKPGLADCNDSELRTRIAEFFAHPQIEARRIFHGRGQRFPGLEHVCVDWFKPVVLISAYAPVSNAQTLRQWILDADQHRQVETIILQHRDSTGSPSEVLHGPACDNTVVEEAGLKFEVHPGVKQNAGLFLDTRLLRQWLRDHARDRNVLNLFAYTCTLSVAALAGGASRVTNVDISKTSIAWGQRNHRLNDQDERQIVPVPHNLFTSWGRVRKYGRYDLVIIDPPTRQRGSFDAERDYGSVLRKLGKCLNPGALIVAALNSPFLDWSYLHGLLAKHLPEAIYQETIAAPPEFADRDPDKGLKIAVYRMPESAAD